MAEAIAQSGRNDVEVERVDNEQLIRHHIPLDAIPGLLIDGQLVSQNEVPAIETLRDWSKTVAV